mgnify:CR=1 FL=1
MQLSRRLQTVARLVPYCRCLADIGTDHAYVPIWCVIHGICQTALACDVRPGPLQIAKKRIGVYQLGDHISTRLSDGLEALLPGEADTIVIAGMGGLLIADILQRGRAVIQPDTHLILQPMTAIEELRHFLYQNGFRVLDEHVVQEENKFYNLLEVCLGADTASESEIIVGRNLGKEADFLNYMAFCITKTEKIICGMKRSERRQDDLEKHRRRLALYREAVGKECAANDNLQGNRGIY